MITMMALGSFRFGLDQRPYTQATRSWQYEYAEHQRLGRAAALHFVSRPAREISLSGVIYPQYRGGLGQIEDMSRVAELATPMLLVDGIGRVWGRFVIAELEETLTHFLPSGAARKLEFTIGLKSYG